MSHDTPRSKSPSYLEENENEEDEEAPVRPRTRVFDEIQRQLGQELANTDRLLATTQELLAQGKSDHPSTSTPVGHTSRNYSYAGSESRRVPSSRQSPTREPRSSRAPFEREDHDPSRSLSRPYTAGTSQHEKTFDTFKTEDFEAFDPEFKIRPLRGRDADRHSQVFGKDYRVDGSNFFPEQSSIPHHSRAASNFAMESTNRSRGPSNLAWEPSRGMSDEYYDKSGAFFPPRYRFNPSEGNLTQSSEFQLSENLSSRIMSNINEFAGLGVSPRNFLGKENMANDVFSENMTSGRASRGTPENCRSGAGSSMTNRIGSFGLRAPSPTASRSSPGPNIQDVVCEKGPSMVTFALGSQPCENRFSPTSTPMQTTSQQYSDQLQASEESSSIPTSYYVSCGSRLTPSPYSLAATKEYSSAGSGFNAFWDPYPDSRVQDESSPAPVSNTTSSSPQCHGQQWTPSSELSSSPHRHVSRIETPGLQELSSLSGLKRCPSRCKVFTSTPLANPCRGRTSPERVLPKKPDLTPDEIQELIQCESRDVESAQQFIMNEKKTYKKPCPKQQKAQMDIEHVIHTHAHQPSTSQTCEKAYPPLIDPDPEDISPEVAAAMMFSQEQGIRMESCPAETIKYLFPDDRRGPQYVEKILASNISIVDPNQRDQEELMEKSALVPSEGVSDSAYTRTMKLKGGDMGSRRSYDLDMAFGPGKREYVLVAQRPERFNKIQFRGNLPNWFPGYFSAFPDQPEYQGSIKVVPSPSGLFQKAWAATNPKNIPKNDVVVLQ